MNSTTKQSLLMESPPKRSPPLNMLPAFPNLQDDLAAPVSAQPRRIDFDRETRSQGGQVRPISCHTDTKNLKVDANASRTYICTSQQVSLWKPNCSCHRHRLRKPWTSIWSYEATRKIQAERAGGSSDEPVIEKSGRPGRFFLR